MIEKTFYELLKGYQQNLLTQDELSHFLNLIQQEQYADIVKKEIGKILDETEGVADEKRGEQIFSNMMSTVKSLDTSKQERDSRRSFKLISFLKMSAAAAVIIMGLFFWFAKTDKKELAQTVVKPIEHNNDVLPGGDKAILTLANGTTIVLNDAQDGQLAQQGTTKIIKIDGMIAYGTSGQSSEVLYNTISTPNGGQYQIALPDGTLVWLNAASSLHFPTAFVGKDRRVEITGEAYFEVAKDASKPFIVAVNKAEIQVLGTHFNVMAYKDEEAVKTTLLEGAVNFISGTNSNPLKPGQQAQLLNNGQTKVLNGVDVEEVIAWKNGLFRFESSDLQTVLRQLARWYDVEMIFRSNNFSEPFHVEISRNTNLSNVLKALQLSGGAKFRIEGKKVIVTQ